MAVVDGASGEPDGGLTAGPPPSVVDGPPGPLVVVDPPGPVVDAPEPAVVDEPAPAVVGEALPVNDVVVVVVAPFVDVEEVTPLIAVTSGTPSSMLAGTSGARRSPPPR